MTNDEPIGTTTCPICGTAEPHFHNVELVNEWREQYPDPDMRIPFDSWWHLKYSPFGKGHLGDYMDQIRKQNQDLAMLVRSLVWTLDKYAPDHSMTWKAKDYLTRNNLQGSVLRGE